MNVDIVDMRQFDENNQGIDVAFPVLAIECEATPPLENYLDAYEEAVLKLVSLGLSTGGITKTLRATESLIEEVLAHLENKRYAKREIGRPWEITEDGEKYLKGLIDERASEESKYGYMFVNAIKKDVFPYFLEGNVGQQPLSQRKEGRLPLKITINGDEDQTFAPIEIKHSKLKKAYKTYFRMLKLLEKDEGYDEDTSDKEAVIDLFADLDSFEEELEEGNEYGNEKKSTSLTENMFIRSLEKKPVKLYLRMRIIIDPSSPGGYIVESPFDDFGGSDGGFFLRQLQWMEQSETVYLDGELLQDFLHRETCKLSPSYKDSEKDFQVFVLEKMPLMKLYRSRIPYVYEDMERIYALMLCQNSLIEKENIVNNLARRVVEKLFNSYFRAIDRPMLEQVQQKAFDDLTTYGCVTYKEMICRNAQLNEDTLSWVKESYLRSILGRMNRTYGNSIIEKFVNMLVIEFYLGDAKVHRFLFQPGIVQRYELIDKLNQIRRKVSHDTADRFTNEDYDYYIAHVFDIVNSLLEAFREE